MSVSKAFADVARGMVGVAKETHRIAVERNAWTPWALKRAIDIEEAELRLRAVTGPHADTALAWARFRTTFGDLSYLEALEVEWRHAAMYGPHTIPPHPDKMPKEAP